MTENRNKTTTKKKHVKSKQNSKNRRIILQNRRQANVAELYREYQSLREAT